PRSDVTPVPGVAKMAVERAAAELKAVRADHVGARADVVFMNGANEIGLLGELMIGPSAVTPQDLGADGAIENHRPAAREFLSGGAIVRGGAHARAPPPSSINEPRRAAIGAGPVPQPPPRIEAPRARQRTASAA